MDKTERSPRRERNGVGIPVRVLAGMAMCAGLQGCVVVGGSSRGGFFLWPGGGLGLLVLIVLFVLLMRRR